MLTFKSLKATYQASFVKYKETCKRILSKSKQLRAINTLYSTLTRQEAVAVG